LARVTTHIKYTMSFGRVRIRAQRSAIKRIIHQITLGHSIETAVEGEILYSPNRAQFTLQSQLPERHYHRTPATGLCMLHAIHQMLNEAAKHGAYLPYRLAQLLQQTLFKVQHTESTKPFYITLIDIILSEVRVQPDSFPYFMEMDIDAAINQLKQLEIYLRKPGSGDRPIPGQHYLANTIGRLAPGAVGLEAHEWTHVTSDQAYNYIGSTKSTESDYLFSAHHLRRALGAMHQFGYRSSHFFVLTVDETLIHDFDEALQGLSLSLISVLRVPDNLTLACAYAASHTRIEHITAPPTLTYRIVQPETLTPADRVALHSLVMAGYNVLPFHMLDLISRALNIRVVASKAGLNRGLALGGLPVPANTLQAEYVGLPLTRSQMETLHINPIHSQLSMWLRFRMAPASTLGAMKSRVFVRT
jgi:hypothetical protein